MKFMYVVSPHFLRPIVAESSDFSFAVRGYCSIRDGVDNLKFSNFEDIKGFIFCFYELPKKLMPLVKFINYLDDLCEKPVVICSCVKDGMSLLIKHVHHKHIKLFVVTPVDDMTDIVIRRDLFGTILRETDQPYVKESKKETEEEQDRGMPKYVPILPKIVNRLYDRVIQTDDVQSALNFDTALRFYKGNSDILYFLRTQQILKKNGKFVDKSNELAKILKNNPDKYMYKALYRMIEEGKL